MPVGHGYWLEPRSGALYLVTTHNDWLLDPENQTKIGLGPEKVGVLNSLDPVKEIDEIRMVGVMAGLVRIRDYRNRVSVQFYSPPAEVEQLLQSVVEAMPNVTFDKHPFLTIQNLRDDSIARIHLMDLVAMLRAAEPVLRSTAVVAYNQSLRKRMDRLLRKITD